MRPDVPPPYAFSDYFFVFLFALPCTPFDEGIVNTEAKSYYLTSCISPLVLEALISESVKPFESSRMSVSQKSKAISIFFLARLKKVRTLEKSGAES